MSFVVPEGESSLWIQFVFLVFEVIYMERTDGKGKSCRLVARSLLKVFRNHLKLVGFSRNLASRSPTLGINKRPEGGKDEMGRNKKSGYNWTG